MNFYFRGDEGNMHMVKKLYVKNIKTRYNKK